MKQTKIYACFSGSGKTYAQSKYPDKVLDLESSYYKYKGLSQKTVESLKGSTNRILNADFVKDYVNAIIDNIGKVEVLFISQHDEILARLDELGIKYTIVFYEDDMARECLTRCKNRGNSPDFVWGIASKWGYFCKKYQVEGAILLNHDKPFISDWLELE